MSTLRLIDLVSPHKGDEPKKIEFMYAMNHHFRTKDMPAMRVFKPTLKPSFYDNVVLLQEKYYDTDLDLMFAFNNGDSANSTLYLGYWNGGVV